MLRQYISVGKERLRCGYTTGTCAAAAALGAATLLLKGEALPAVQIDTPAGVRVEAEPLDFTAGPDWASCAVRKDGGDDPDVTDGTLVYARVEKAAGHRVEIDGGLGVGQVTKPGLDQPVGAAAINSVPRKMIAGQLAPFLKETGLHVVISVPDGARLAGHTFNPRLGIEGGISILGTSGIVRPMSEAALVETLRIELNMCRTAGGTDVVITPGNYGEDFSRQVLGLSLHCWATCSNYIGEAIDYAAFLGFESLLLVGHLGKLCKVAAGCMNTHSRIADGRRETLCAHTALCGGDRGVLRAVFDAATTDEAVAILDNAGLRQPVMDAIAIEIGRALQRRAGKMETGALFFSNRYGVLGKTPGADRLIARHVPETEEGD